MMKTLTADENLLKAMQQISEPTEIVDADGRPIVSVFPSERQPNPEFLREIEQIFDFDELQRLSQSDRSTDRPFADVVARLKAMEPQT